MESTNPDAEKQYRIYMGKRPQFEVRMRIVCVGAGYFAQYHVEA